ncbi:MULTISPECIES: hypothetical protein [unclassified Treponema]|uniref:hypothetical protein n=1 Tax=unclassified Treponema TaxID=2638727 RepID=UPI0020A27385|nr:MULTISPECIES: hypothetical protein [unclassified Treponema]UTC66253.1 hypothetical protein E4O06_09690 [Treponema sp. OMZ 789]UTC68984.1 hypothetical protein E4O01_09830 [Treponema sp. OMZ 790]
MKKIKKVIILIIIFVITGCVNPYNRIRDGESGIFEEGNDLEGNEDEEGGTNPFEDKLFIKEGEKIILKTNNAKYWGVRGYTLWKFLGKEINKKEPSIKVVKKEGASEAGYGLVCYSTKTEAGQKKYRMLVILIHVDGKYSIGYVVNGLYKHIEWKKQSEKLNKGYGVENIISVKKEGKKIEIYFNDEKYSGNPSYTINDSSEYLLGEGEAGLIGVVSAKDKFPDDFVWIEYKVK